jgi:branched-chain amino acid transport system permease protein
VVNFAHGELLMLAMYGTFVIHQNLHLDPLVQLPLIAAVMFGVGVAIYRVLIARALDVQFNTGMVQIFVTFGLSIFLVGAAQLTFGSDFRSISNGFLSDQTFMLGPVILPMSQVLAGLVCLLAFGVLALISRTEFGRALEATREDRDAVALIGIDRNRVFSIGWGIGAAAVGIAGVMLATFYYISPTVGDNFALIAYVTVALGGFGSLLGALIAGLLVGVVEALTALVIDPSLKQIGIFAIYVLVLMFRPRGLLGRL